MADVRISTFEGRKTAGKALDTIEEERGYRWSDNVAVISKSKNGFIRIHSTWAHDDSDLAVGVSFGALTGALIGAMMGPGGAIAGAAGAGAFAGGSLGGMFGGLVELIQGDPRLDRFASTLTDDTSALILVGDEQSADEFVSVFSPLNGELIETNLNEHDVNALREALRAEHARGA